MEQINTKLVSYNELKLKYQLNIDDVDQFQSEDC